MFSHWFCAFLWCRIVKRSIQRTKSNGNNEQMPWQEINKINHSILFIENNNLHSMQYVQEISFFSTLRKWILLSILSNFDTLRSIVENDQKKIIHQNILQFYFFPSHIIASVPYNWRCNIQLAFLYVLSSKMKNLFFCVVVKKQLQGKKKNKFHIRTEQVKTSCV